MTPVLVAEADRDTRTVLRDLLDDEGYTVATVLNGRTVLAVLRESSQPLVVLLDQRLPDLRGTEVFGSRARGRPCSARVRGADDASRRLPATGWGAHPCQAVLTSTPCWTRWLCQRATARVVPQPVTPARVTHSWSASPISEPLVRARGQHSQADGTAAAAAPAWPPCRRFLHGAQW